MLVTEDMVKAHEAGSVIVDMWRSSRRQLPASVSKVVRSMA